ncbi:MAG: M48 family metalloprotease [Nibricoccus sp.]
MTPPVALSPLPYHREVRDYLKSSERELWDWFISARAKENYAEELRLSLLKATYRLSAETHADLYRLVESAKVALGFDIPVTLYQAQNGGGPNASIYCLPNEAHIVMSGAIASLLDAEELKSVFGHELAHYFLWSTEDEEYMIADRVLTAVTNDGRAHAAHHETARQYRLHTEIFADRGAAHVTQNLPKVVAALVKSTTGLTQVSGDSYLEQAAEIFSKEEVRTEELTHPESYVRAHALALWTRQGDAANSSIRGLIEGKPELQNLDLIGQRKLTQLTRRFLAELLRPGWFQSIAVIGQAKLYFPDFTANQSEDVSITEELRETGSLLKDYFAFLLLDFAHVDRELEDVPLAAALRWAENLGISSHFEKLVGKELGIKTRELNKLKPRISDLLALAEKGAQS